MLPAAVAVVPVDFKQCFTQLAGCLLYCLKCCPDSELTDENTELQQLEYQFDNQSSVSALSTEHPESEISDKPHHDSSDGKVTSRSRTSDKQRERENVQWKLIPSGSGGQGNTVYVQQVKENGKKND